MQKPQKCTQLLLPLKVVNLQTKGFFLSHLCLISSALFVFVPTGWYHNGRFGNPLILMGQPYWKCSDSPLLISKQCGKFQSIHLSSVMLLNLLQKTSKKPTHFQQKEFRINAHNKNSAFIFDYKLHFYLGFALDGLQSNHIIARCSLQHNCCIGYDVVFLHHELEERADARQSVLLTICVSHYGNYLVVDQQQWERPPSVTRPHVLHLRKIK